MMKRCLPTIAIIVTSVIVSCLIMGSLQSRAGVPVEPVCGDLNEDGALTLSDPLILLEHMFSGSPAPVCAQGTPLTIEAIDDLLSQYLPRSDQYVRRHVSLQPGETDEWFVPDGHVFLWKYGSSSSSVQVRVIDSRGEEIPQIGLVPNSAIPASFLVPGQGIRLTALAGSGSQSTEYRGYLLRLPQ